MTKVAYELAKTHVGTWEWAEGDNPKILKWFGAVGHSWVMNDETAWCAAFVGAMLREAGVPSTGKLDARSYLYWGQPVALDEAREGDLVVFWRVSRNSWQGHVGFYVSRDGAKINVLGGNQANQVNIRPYSASRLLGVRRWPMPKPEPRSGLWSTIKGFFNGNREPTDRLADEQTRRRRSRRPRRN